MPAAAMSVLTMTTPISTTIAAANGMTMVAAIAAPTPRPTRVPWDLSRMWPFRFQQEQGSKGVRYFMPPRIDPTMPPTTPPSACSVRWLGMYSIN